MVQFDRIGGAIRRGAAFDYVGVERALGQEFCILDFERLARKALDECVADDAALFLWIRTLIPQRILELGSPV